MLIRKIVAVVLGFALWSGLWLAGNAALASRAEPHAGSAGASPNNATLAWTLGVSIACSLAAGAVAGAIMSRRHGAMQAACVLGALLLLVGIAVQGGAWSSMPLWYHLCFLAMLLPATLAGARLSAGRPVA